METIEVLLPINYKVGHKVTDKIIRNLKMIYPNIVFNLNIEGIYSKIIILNSFIPHNTDVLKAYAPNDTWYYMYDMNWGRQWYEENKPMQLLTDKPYPGSRFIIPTGMMALSSINRPTMGKRFGKLCIMESNKPERFEQYNKYLQSHSLSIDVIGSTMNREYRHTGNKLDSVPYEYLPELLSDYSYCLILWDEYHNKDNLPLKVAECLENGVIPILVAEFGDTEFPTVNSVLDIISYITTTKGKEVDEVYRLIEHHKDSINIQKIIRSAELIETDELYLRELEELLVWGREKHRGHYWRDNLDVKDFIDALKRHLYAYESGETIDPETGLSHLISIGANAMFKRRIDEEN